MQNLLNGILPLASVDGDSTEHFHEPTVGKTKEAFLSNPMDLHVQSPANRDHVGHNMRCSNHDIAPLFGHATNRFPANQLVGTIQWLDV